MTDVPDWLRPCPGPLRASLLRCADGAWSPNLALMRIVLDAADRRQAEQAIRVAAEAGKVLPPGQGGWLRGVANLWHAWPGAWDAIRSVSQEIDHDADAGSPREIVTRFAAGFDRAVRMSPEASVALYGLGSATILGAATAELAGLLRRWGLLGPDREVLDIGCGIGRLEEAIGPEVAAMLGLDIAPAMIEIARRRCAGLAGVTFVLGNGEDLSAIGERRFDLVLAVDSFPYIVHAGGDLVAGHVAGAAEAMHGGGDLVVFNWSYRGDIEADRRDVAQLAAKTGLDVIRSGTSDLDLWDGAAFHLRKPAGGAAGT